MAPGGTSLIVRPGAVSAAVRGIDAVLHLATRIQPLDRIQQAEARQDNDRLCAEASAILVDTALAADVKAHVQPTVTFVYPGDRPISEDTPVGEVPVILRSALAAEQQVGPFAAAGRSGVVLRLGLLDGPGTGKDHPNPSLGATLHSGDAGCALLAALAPHRHLQHLPRRRARQQPPVRKGRRLACLAIASQPAGAERPACWPSGPLGMGGDGPRPLHRLGVCRVDVHVVDHTPRRAICERRTGQLGRGGHLRRPIRAATQELAPCRPKGNQGSSQLVNRTAEPLSRHRVIPGDLSPAACPTSGWPRRRVIRALARARFPVR